MGPRKKRSKVRGLVHVVDRNQVPTTAPTAPSPTPADGASVVIPSPPGRFWAIGVLVLAAVVSMSMNTVHAFESTSLPAPLAAMYGIAPVALAAMQSHAVALRALRREQVGAFRKALTFGLVIGGLGLSFLGIYDLLRHAVPDPIEWTPIHEPAVLFSIVVDLMALAALHELLRLTPSLVSAPEAAPVDGPAVYPDEASESAQDDASEVRDEPAPVQPESAFTLSNLPVFGPFTPIPPVRPATIAANGSAARTLTVTEAVPESPASPEADAPGEEQTSSRRRSTEAEKRKARDMYRRSVEVGTPMTQEELGDRCGGWTRSWAKDRIAEVDRELLADGWKKAPEGTYTRPPKTASGGA